ncbi:hypothetical protein CEUSTIGMA_g4781.t1 [Chlamydomonas eustigma]|uniref:Uncharacterized protein n=1 Tax=Chlamydomonas eustigma TaxID=1157962 RepID=A0A250X2Q3_9CHLO|nr:hypothetical protein CEUSTIGMA_g4781.t1 [Chlamydomonas eustigma]|eukprot:GAX77335.1 hypothetical protein CEUSTIGMA_g4781.t1 [Chlamydomonas eustigma]
MLAQTILRACRSNLLHAHSYVERCSQLATSLDASEWSFARSISQSQDFHVLPSSSGAGNPVWPPCYAKPAGLTSKAALNIDETHLSGTLCYRGYAKAAASAKSGGDAGKDQPKKYRRSYTRLFACRNDRFRSAFEQIWPTFRLTGAEQEIFKRNSKLFVVETGRPISLKQKFNMLRPTAEDPESSHALIKPHYAHARSMLYESDMHLDAAGEHPRYLKIRKIRTQYGVRLQNLRKVRILLGFVRRGYLQKLYEEAQVQSGTNKVWKLICAMESKLAMFALRMGLSHDILGANAVVLKGKVHLNGTPPPLNKAYYMQPGDVVSPVHDELHGYKDQLASDMGPVLRDVHREIFLL